MKRTRRANRVDNYVIIHGEHDYREGRDAIVDILLDCTAEEALEECVRLAKEEAVRVSGEWEGLVKFGVPLSFTLPSEEDIITDSERNEHYLCKASFSYNGIFVSYKACAVGDKL